MFWSLFWVNNFFKLINLFAIFASEDGKQLLSRLYVAIFKFCAEKCRRDAEDAEVAKLCGSAPPHPVRCPDLSLQFFLPLSHFCLRDTKLNLISAGYFSLNMFTL